MKYKKFSNTTTAKPQTSNVSINSLEEIPLPNEIEIQPDTPKNSSSSTTVENSLSLQRLLKNIELDDLLLFAILILFLQEDVSDQLLVALIVILIIQK